MTQRQHQPVALLRCSRSTVLAFLSARARSQRGRPLQFQPPCRWTGSATACTSPSGAMGNCLSSASPTQPTMTAVLWKWPCARGRPPKKLLAPIPGSRANACSYCTYSFCKKPRFLHRNRGFPFRNEPVVLSSAITLGRCAPLHWKPNRSHFPTNFPSFCANHPHQSLRSQRLRFR